METLGQIEVKTTKKGMNERWRIWGLGDVHKGHAGYKEDLYYETIEAIRVDPYSRAIIMGDMLDLISWQDKRFDPDCVAEKTRSAYFQKFGPTMRDGLISDLTPIKDKILVMLHGNHEWSYEHRMDDALTQTVADTLGVRFGGYCAMFDLVIRNRQRQWKKRFVCHHGSSFAATPGGKINALMKFMNAFESDIYFMGHVHEKLDFERPAIGANKDCTAQSERAKFGVITGSFLRGYVSPKRGASTYVERKMYAPVPLGPVSLTIVPSTGKMGIEK